MVAYGMATSAQITAITPTQTYQGDSLYTTITSSGVFLIGSSPQGNIKDILFKNATDSVFAISDSTNVVDVNTATTFWRIPDNIATGLYTLVVRVYNNLFSGPTTDQTLNNSFNITSRIWPGDADDNQVVDNNDLLPIGLGYGGTGNTRPDQSISWIAHSGIDWPQFFTSYTPAINYKYADCDGNGTINAADTLAIHQNFSLTHSKTNGSRPWRSGIPALIPVFDKGGVYNGDTLTVSFVLGDTSIPASHIYGVAFTYHYDPQIMDSTFTNITYGSSWLGSTADKINISKAFHSQGQIKIAQTRIDHTARSGSGPIGRASFKITTDNISGLAYGPYVQSGYITDVTLVDSTGHIIPVNEGADTTSLMYYPDGIGELSQKMVRIMPNPASTWCNISAADDITEVLIMDISGKEMWHNRNVNSRSLDIDISVFRDGLYFAQVKTRRGSRTEKLLKIK
ncbi:MAG: hypothetical protein JWO03_3478 [Bacteroidetes bacterium]|nr:hypothetical protein [Bacteroidota bacterium]